MTARQMISRAISHEKKIDYLWILLGTALMAVSSNLFYAPAGVIPGGFTGLGIIIQEVTEPLIKGGVPLWFTNLVLNIPLFLIVIKIRGFRFMSRTIITTVLFSAWLFVIPEIPLVADDLFLTAVIGGALMGFGVGLTFLGKGTTGGTDTVAALINKVQPHISSARILPVLDGAIILLSVWIFGVRNTLYAIVSVAISGYLSDHVLYGVRNANLAFIISDHNDEIADALLQDMSRGVTRLKGTGMYTDTERSVLLCAVSKRQTVIVKEIVSAIDPTAFLILTDAGEIRGEGFLDYSHEELG